MSEEKEVREMEATAGHDQVRKALGKQLKNMQPGELLIIEIQIIGRDGNEKNGRKV